jgi:hypothetical protein
MFHRSKNPNAVFNVSVVAGLAISVAVVMATLADAVLRSQSFI